MHRGPRGLIVEIGDPAASPPQLRRTWNGISRVCDSQKAEKTSTPRLFAERHRLTDESALADARRSATADDTPVAADRSINMPVMVCSSTSAPTKVGCAGPVDLVIHSDTRRRCAVTARRCLILTSSGSPSTAACSTSRAWNH